MIVGISLATIALTAQAQQGAIEAPRLILISVDGLRPDVITQESAPRLSALRESGANAVALNDLPSATLPNHATMLSGLVSDHHGLILNFDIPGVFPFPTLITLASDAGDRVGYFVSKTKLLYLAEPAALSVSEYAADTDTLIDRVIEQFANLDVIFIHLRDPDSNGHQHGWLSPEYLAAVTKSEAQIGRVLDALPPDAITYVLVTADHGGAGLNHFANIPEDRDIPWIVVGPDIPAGLEVCTDVTTADTLPTALRLIGLDIPAGLDGRPISFSDDNADFPSPVVPPGLPCVLFLAPILITAGVVATRRPIV
ncbi:MAG: alkaline phosphatase family protein [Phycisphaerales bacterium]|nr:alkaline phosphatase family protein [Phycisphaerales bacterium]